MFETADNFEFVLIVGFGRPHILIDEGQVFLDGGREIVVIFDEIAHSFSLEILYLVQNDIYSLIQVAFLFALPSVQLSIKFQHGLVTFGVGSSDSVFD